MHKRYPLWLVCGVVMVVAVRVNAATVYLADDWRNLYAVDTSTWAAINLGQTPATMSDIALDSAGNLYGITASSASRLYVIDPGNPAAATQVGTASMTGANALAFGPGDELYAASTFQRLFLVDRVSGANTQLAGVLPLPSSGDLAFDADGNLYMAGFGGSRGGDRLVDVNPVPPVSGTPIGWLGASDMLGLAFADGVVFGFAGQNAYMIDPTTGAATDLGAISGMAAGTSVWGAASGLVPEPTAAAWFLASGIATLASRKRRPLLRRAGSN